MDCAVFSPCGRYWVRFHCQGDYMLLLLSSKEAGDISAYDKRPSLAAKLDAHMVEDISASAGVKKDFENFSNMVYNALIGKSASVSFFIENCDEMKARIRSKSVQTSSSRAKGTHTPQRGGDGVRRHDNIDDSGETITSSAVEEDDSRAATTADDEASMFEREFFLQRKFFTLDYCVDFTRAIFPIPLEPYAPEVHTLGIAAAGLHNGLPAGGDSSNEDDRRMIRRLQAENKRLKKENEALTLLSTEKMAEMQRVCEDLQRRAVNETEYRKIKKDFADAKKRIEVLERTNDKLQREVHRAPTPTRRATSPSTTPRTTHRGRFDTPPHERNSNERGRYYNQQRSPASSRASTPPRSPRPAWGQHTVSKQMTANSRHHGLSTSGDSNFSGGLYGGTRKPSGGRSTSPHDRLYMMDTAASSNLRRTRDPHRALFH